MENLWWLLVRFMKSVVVFGRFLWLLFLARVVLKCSWQFLEDLGLSADFGCCQRGCLVLFGLLIGNRGPLRLLFGGLGLAVQRIWLLFGGCGLLGCFLVGLGLLSNKSSGLVTHLSVFIVFYPSGFECLFWFHHVF